MIKPVQNNIITFKSKSQPINESLNIHRKFIDNGFYEKPNASSRFKYLYSEIEEFKNAVKNNDRQNMEEEIGDVIFDAILLADYYKINPTKALEQTNEKLSSRLSLAQKYAKKPLIEYTFNERMQFWEQAKKTLRQENLDITG